MSWSIRACVVTICFFRVLDTTQGDWAAPEYALDLDLPARERWGHIALDLVHKHGWECTYKPVLDFIDTVFPKDTWVKYDDELRKVAEPIIGQEEVEELKGIQDAALSVGHNVTLSELEFFQIFYEILMQCTGILARDQHGHIVHGRNMDIGLPVQNLTAQVVWKRHGKAVLTTTQYVGYIGVHTGMRNDGWTVQANERVVLTPGPVIGYDKAILIDTAAAFLEGHQPVGKFVRSVLLDHAEYESALPVLEHTPLASPMYLIVGGKTQGTVITRDRNGPATESQDTSLWGRQPVPPNANVLPVTDFFLVQTNWDPWINETQAQCIDCMAAFTPAQEELCEDYIRAFYGDKGKCDDLCQLYSDGRAEAATASMETLSPAVIDQQMNAVLSKPPVLAGGTKFTTVMSASSNRYETTVRSPPQDFPPRGTDNANDAVVLERLRVLVREMTGLTHI